MMQIIYQVFYRRVARFLAAIPKLKLPSSGLERVTLFDDTSRVIWVCWLKSSRVVCWMWLESSHFWKIMKMTEVESESLKMLLKSNQHLFHDAKNAHDGNSERPVGRLFYNSRLQHLKRKKNGSKHGNYVSIKHIHFATRKDRQKN